MLAKRPALYKWQSCPRCGRVQQIILASSKPTTCTSCGFSPIVLDSPVQPVLRPAP